MKKYLLFSAFFSLILITSFREAESQPVNFIWADGAGGTFNDWGQAITADNNGYIYITGAFQSHSITFGTTTLNNSGVSGWNDMFIAKIDNNGNNVWAKSTLGTYTEEGWSIATDNNSNVYITGYHTDPCTFGTVTLPSGGMFIVKYDSSGNVVWAKGTQGGYGTNLTIDDSANILVTGYYPQNTINFDTIQLTNRDTTGKNEIFIAKYDSSGNVLWAKSVGGSGYDGSNGIATDHSGNIYITGDFQSDTLFFGSIFITDAGSSDIFIAKYDNLGNPFWAKSVGGISPEIGRSIGKDDYGNFYVTGYYLSSSLNIDTITLTNIGIGADIFTAKFDSLGNVLWAKSFGGTNGDVVYNSYVDKDGNVFETGVFSSTVATFGATQLYNHGGDDIFILRYDSAGNELWALSAGDTINDTGFGITADNNGGIFITGGFSSSSINFGSTQLTNAYTTRSDIFISKIGSISSGIKGEELQNGLKIYLNPSKDQLIINGNQLAINSIDVYNLLGEMQFHLSSGTTNSNLKAKMSQTIDVSGFPSGIYFVKVNGKDFSETKKLIIAK